MRAQVDARSASKPVAGGTPCGAQRDFLEHIVRMVAVGELKLAQEARRAASAP